jgi:hypothetical protein
MHHFLWAFSGNKHQPLDKDPNVSSSSNCLSSSLVPPPLSLSSSSFGEPHLCWSRSTRDDGDCRTWRVRSESDGWWHPRWHRVNCTWMVDARIDASQYPIPGCLGHLVRTAHTGCRIFLLPAPVTLAIFTTRPTDADEARLLLSLEPANASPHSNLTSGLSGQQRHPSSQKRLILEYCSSVKLP